MISGWEIEDMIADENSRIWEAMNPPEADEEEPEEEPEHDLGSAEWEIDRGLKGLGEAATRLQNAIDDAEGHPVAARIQAVLTAVENTESWLNTIREMIHKEMIERESA